jgi:uncharacterized protein (DUF608 family)
MRMLFEPTAETGDFTTLSFVEGFGGPVPGIVFTEGHPPCCGVPLGGIGTGCVDFDLRGYFGWNTLFNPSSQIQGFVDGRNPRRFPDIQPVFGFSLGEKTYCLATEEILKGGTLPWCTAPDFAVDPSKPLPQHHLEVPATDGVLPATSIRYYGHFPVADAEYGFDAPITVGVRAWSSFIPGDSAKSNIPAAVFEVHVRNLSGTRQSGDFAMNFAGPDPQEARSAFFTKTRIEERAIGLHVRSDGGVGYFLGVLDGKDVRTGTGLSGNAREENGYGTGRFRKRGAWASLGEGLPQDERFIEVQGVRKTKDPSASVSVPFQLEGGAEATIRFLLAWHAPILDSTVRDRAAARAAEFEVDWHPDDAYGTESHNTQMYATRYDSALDVMRRMGRDHGALLKKVLAWQETLLKRDSLPAWLRDSLLNVLSLLAEDGYWFMPKYPLGDWAFPGGAFTYYESPRDCPHSSCIPNDWIGTMPLAYLFPDLFLQLLRSYKGLQRKDGEIPFAVGRVGDLPNLCQPEYTWQMSLNGTCYILMVVRLWLVTKDDRILQEFYGSIKACHRFMSTLARKGWLCMPDRGGSEWFEHSRFYGYTSHVGGLHLSQLLVVERLAKRMGDTAFAETCRREYEEAKAILNDKLWTGTHYLTWLDEETGRRNDDVMAYQLDGILTNAQSGIEEKMVDEEKIRIILDTVHAANVKLGNGFGALNYAKADGTLIADDADAYGKYCVFTQNTIVLAMTGLYCGDRERSLKLAESTWRNLIVKQRLGWDLTHIVDARDGHRVFGAEYNQQAVIWSLPAALEGKDASGPCEPGGIVFEMLKSAREAGESNGSTTGGSNR